MIRVEAPRADGSAEIVELGDPEDLSLDFSIPSARAAFAAVHVVDRADADRSRPVRDQIDWDATLAYRRYLWSLGLGVAEAMDTAQRGLLGWDAASELLDRTLAEARASRSRFPWPAVIGGAGTDGLTNGDASLGVIVDEYVRQARFIQERGGVAMLLATPLLTARHAGPRDYVDVYSRVVKQLEPPLFVHWLGEMFAPNLAGYFPGSSFWEIMEGGAEKIRGVKISLLDESLELAVRARIAPSRQIVLTGDDYNYPQLIRGTGGRAETGPRVEIAGRSFPTGEFSHALLGIFDAIAPVAAKALERLSAGAVGEYERLMSATTPLARKLFEPPTENYKAGVVFLAYLNGHQERFSLLGDLHLRRTRDHYIELFKLAAACGALRNPADAAERVSAFLKT